jgi:hypothetical protein
MRGLDMDIWTKKALIEMLDAATTRKAVIDLVNKYNPRLGHVDKKAVWEYAMLRFNRLPDDGTLIYGPSEKTASEVVPVLDVRALLHRVIIAAGLSRVYKHLADGPFASMSAWRPQFSPEENSRRDSRLRVRLHNRGLGFLPVKGVWNNLEGDLDREDSLFIVGIDRQVAVDLAHHFQQVEIIWGDAGSYNFVGVESGMNLRGGLVAERFHYLDPGEVPPTGKTEVHKKPFTFRDAAFTGVINAEECYGGWAIGDRQRWWPGFSRSAHLERNGKACFFWNRLGSKLTFPRFGFYVEKEGEYIVDEDKCDLGYEAYLPLGPHST